MYDVGGLRGAIADVRASDKDIPVTRVCYATADTPRAILALVFPFAFLVALVLILIGKGYSLSDFPAVAGQVRWFPQVVGWLSFVAWIVRYFPPAWTALWDGPCPISSDGRDLFLPADRKVSLASIREVTVRRGLLRKVAHIHTDEDQISVNLLFVRPSSDPLLRSLANRKAPSS